MAAETALAKHREASATTIRKMGEALDKAQQKVRDQEGRFTNPYRSDLDRAVAAETATAAQTFPRYDALLAELRAAEQRANDLQAELFVRMQSQFKMQDERDALADALREIAGMTDPTADRNDDLIYGAQCVRIARAALDRHTEGRPK